MKKIMIITFFALVATFPAKAQFGNLIDKAKETLTGESSDGANIGLGLKEALEVGVTDAVSSLSATNGYFESPYKILIPEEARKITSKVSKIPGFKNVEKDLVAKMNEAAEVAAKKAAKIFIGSIKQMSFKDATGILMGDDDAATRFLENSSRETLYSEFMPIIQSSLDEVNATSYWQSVVEAYNKIPFVKKLNPELDDHVNDKALDGMFSLIQEKEEGIRKDKNLRTSPLLKDVFSQLDK